MDITAELEVLLSETYHSTPIDSMENIQIDQDIITAYIIKKMGDEVDLLEFDIIAAAKKALEDGDPRMLNAIKSCTHPDLYNFTMGERLERAYKELDMTTLDPMHYAASVSLAQCALYASQDCDHYLVKEYTIKIIDFMNDEFRRKLMT